MNVQTVKTLTNWLKIDLYELFTMAHESFYGTVIAEAIYQDVLIAHNNKEIPVYVSIFIYQSVYPTLIRENK